MVDQAMCVGLCLSRGVDGGYVTLTGDLRVEAGRGGERVWTFTPCCRLVVELVSKLVSELESKLLG